MSSVQVTITKKQYKAYLNSAAWKELARQAKVDADWACQACDAIDVKLDPHHRSYRRVGTKDELRDVIVLCSRCHSLLTNGNKNKGSQSGG